MRTTVIFLILSFHLQLPAAAQDAFYTHYQTFDAKNGYKVFEKPALLTQDRKGLVWIGSDNGLYSFDGTHFKNYRHRKNDSSSLPSNWVFYNYQDKEGVYWTAVPGHGLYNFNSQTGAFSRFQYSNQNEFNIHEHGIQPPIETKSGALWFPLANYGVARYDRQQNKIIPYKICPMGSCGNYYSTSFITFLAEDPDDGTLWAASNDGLVHFFPADGRFVVYRDAARINVRHIMGQVSTSFFF